MQLHYHDSLKMTVLFIAITLSTSVVIQQGNREMDYRLRMHIDALACTLINTVMTKILKSWH